jgi:hypothetical protein
MGFPLNLPQLSPPCISFFLSLMLRYVVQRVRGTLAHAPMLRLGGRPPSHPVSSPNGPESYTEGTIWLGP